MDGSGDSLSVAYNAVKNGVPNTDSGDSGILACPNRAMAGRAWSAELDDDICPVEDAVDDLVHSFAENVHCASSANIVVANHAVSGADMLNDFKSQSDEIQKAILTAPEGRRQVIVFMGHNDICGGTEAKTPLRCSSTDLDNQNYCRTSTGAYEREFRNGLDSLIQSVNTTISVVAPARVSQLCLVKDLEMCQPALIIGKPNACISAWNTAGGICISLTADCSDERILDTYNFEKLYRDLQLKVVQEYNNIPEGGRSNTYTYNGVTVGGATKSSGVHLVFSDIIWQSQLTNPDISCCDCFHASVAGQQRLANAAFNGAQCTAATPCCSDSGTPINNAKCLSGTNGVITDGSVIPGIQL